MNIKILIAAHKTYRMPKDSIYLPIHVGKAGKKTDLGYIGDDTGDNISAKNLNYCELTGIYWAYKNLEADYIGLVHYRRHFTLHRKKDKFQSIITRQELEPLLKDYPVILPKKRNYYIETNYSHYIHAHHREGLDLAKAVIKDNYPEYGASFDLVMNRTKAHMFNMFIMRKDYFQEYACWLFSVLSEVEKQLDISDYNPYEARVFGFLAERLLDVFLETKKIPYKELNVMFMESQNWFTKGFTFLRRKFIKSEYH